MTTARYIDRDLINLLQNSEINLSDSDLLRKSLKEILDYKINDNFDMVTIILIGFSFIVIFVCMGYILYKNKKSKKCHLWCNFCITILLRDTVHVPL